MFLIIGIHEKMKNEISTYFNLDFTCVVLYVIIHLILNKHIHDFE